MADLRFVVVSDLHFGHPYSLLTHTDGRGRADLSEPSRPLVGLAAGLRDLLPRVTGTELPQLVLLGDIFDLSFASAPEAMQAFQRMIDLFFCDPGPPILSPEILYVPGNHDHREWRVMRDALFLEEVRDQTGIDLPDGPATTPLVSGHIESRLITALVRARTRDDRFVVHSAYPNFGYVAGDRSVVMHHGHFTEGLYRAVSSLLAELGAAPPATTVEALEVTNGPWIDFVWSSFGDQGPAVADGTYRLYEATLDAGATHDLVRKAAQVLFDHLAENIPVHPATVIGTADYHVTAGHLVRAALDAVVAKAAESERMSHDRVLSQDAVDGVRWYLEQPVRAQLEGTEAGSRAAHAGECSFIFGHTHKPFQDQMLVPGYESPVQVWNTGGWVVDRPTLSDVQGGAAVLVSDDAHVASLRLFNDSINEVKTAVHVAGSGGPQDANNPFLARLEHELGQVSGSFASFEDECLRGIVRRAQHLRSMFFDADSDPLIDLRDPPMPTHGAASAQEVNR